MRLAKELFLLKALTEVDELLIPPVGQAEKRKCPCRRIKLWAYLWLPPIDPLRSARPVVDAGSPVRVDRRPDFSADRAVCSNRKLRGRYKSVRRVENRSVKTVHAVFPNMLVV